MKFQKFAKDIIACIGGKENVVFVTHCATRLRFHLADDTIVNQEVLEKMPEILGITNKGGQYQLIIGADVPQVYKEVSKLVGNSRLNSAQTVKQKTWGAKVLDVITGSITPVIPLICGPGLLSAMLSLLTYVGWMDASGNTYYILSTIAASGLYFLPVFLGFSIAKKIGTEPFFGALAGAVLLHPNLTALSDSGVMEFSLFSLPMKVVAYSSSMVPIFFAVFFLKYVDIFLDRIIPKVMRFFLKPMLLILIVTTATLLVFGPIGTILGDWITGGLLFVRGQVAWLAVGLVGAALPWLTLTGMHLSLLPVAFAGFSSVGYDSLLFPAALGHNIACAGAGFGVALRSKNKDLRALAITNSISALLGVTEPILYTVHMKLRRPLWAVTIASGIAGTFAGLMGVAAITPAGGLLTLGGFIGDAFIWACVGALIAFVIAFIAALLIGYDEHLYDDATKEGETSVQIDKRKLAAPVSGQLMQLEDLSDPAFSTMGAGVAIVPQEDEIKAPADGTITFTIASAHAIGIQAEGLDVLLHAGIDTVNLKGEGFSLHVKEGQTVKKGDLLLTVDREAIRQAGYDPTLIMVVTNKEDYVDALSVDVDHVKQGEDALIVLC